MHVKLPSDWKSLNPNLVYSRLNEILQKTQVCLVNTSPDITWKLSRQKMCYKIFCSGLNALSVHPSLLPVQIFVACMALSTGACGSFHDQMTAWFHSGGLIWPACWLSRNCRIRPLCAMSHRDYWGKHSWSFERELTLRWTVIKMWARYFSMILVPRLLARSTSEGTRAGAPKCCHFDGCPLRKFRPYYCNSNVNFTKCIP